MDERRFDAWTRALAAVPSRRRVLGSLVGGVFAAIGLSSAGEAGKGKGKGKKKGKKKHKKRDKPQSKCKASEDCDDCTTCRQGRCVADPAKDGFLCAECRTCRAGQCVADPSQDGSLCILTCIRCQNGVCAIPDDEVCPEDHRCRPETGNCCPHCFGEECCPPGQWCIDPPAGQRYCCDSMTSSPCGENPDGTFADCCGPTEECCEFLNTCLPRGECCPGDPACDPCGVNEGYTKTCRDGLHHWCCWHDHECGDQRGQCIDT